MGREQHLILGLWLNLLVLQNTDKLTANARMQICSRLTPDDLVLPPLNVTNLGFQYMPFESHIKQISRTSFCTIFLKLKKPCPTINQRKKKKKTDPCICYKQSFVL